MHWFRFELKYTASKKNWIDENWFDSHMEQCVLNQFVIEQMSQLLGLPTFPLRHHPFVSVSFHFCVTFHFLLLSFFFNIFLFLVCHWPYYIFGYFVIRKRRFYIITCLSSMLGLILCWMLNFTFHLECEHFRFSSFFFWYFIKGTSTGDGCWSTKWVCFLSGFINDVSGSKPICTFFQLVMLMAQHCQIVRSNSMAWVTTFDAMLQRFCFQCKTIKKISFVNDGDLLSQFQLRI